MHSFQGVNEIEKGEQRDLSLEDLMSLYGNDLKRMAYLFVNDHAQCEDIVQEVFLSCYRNMASFRHESNYKTWLIRITINKCKDYKKKWSFRNLVYKPLLEPLVKQNGTSTEEGYLQKERSNEMVNVLSGLSPKYKEVLILYYYQDMNVEEIVAVLGANPNTIRSRLSRGRALLKNEWKGGEE